MPERVRARGCLSGKMFPGALQSSCHATLPSYLCGYTRFLGRRGTRAVSVSQAAARLWHRLRTRVSWATGTEGIRGRLELAYGVFAMLMRAVLVQVAFPARPGLRIKYKQIVSEGS